MTEKTAAFNNILRFFFFTLYTLFVLFYCHNSFSQNFAKKSKKTKKYNTTITSKLIDIKQKTQTIDFIDNVVVKNGPDIMTAKKVILFYKKLPHSNKNEIDTINAYEDVKIFTADYVATSELGYYNPKESLFILEKDVIVNNGDSIGVGDKFVYNLITKKGEFITTKEIDIKSKTDNRVSVTIDNKDSKKKKKKANGKGSKEDKETDNEKAKNEIDINS